MKNKYINTIKIEMLIHDFFTSNSCLYTDVVVYIYFYLISFHVTYLYR